MANLFVLRTTSSAEANAAVAFLNQEAATRKQEVESLQVADWLLATTYRSDSPVAGRRAYEDDRWSAVFVGDLVEHKEVPFRSILTALEANDPLPISQLGGIFALAAYDRSMERVIVVGDRRGQKPVFYEVGSGRLLLSSSLATFARLAERPVFDKRWLWESLFFNFAVGTTTFMNGVNRLPPASILTHDIGKAEISIRHYAEMFKPRDRLVQGREALQQAAEVFSKRVPVYFEGPDAVACALTAGWDARTILALAPRDKAITAYTYGSPGCRDLEMAAGAAQALNVDHVPIPFEADFVDHLPQIALETVFLSGGLQSVLRSTLLYVYNTLTNNGDRYPVTVSGIGVDTSFRGHIHTPDLVSPELAALFQGSGSKDAGVVWKNVFGKDYSEFTAHIRQELDSLENRFGPFDSPAHHLTYSVYPLATHHFCGELSIADCFTTIRIPGWDSDLVNLAYSIEFSSLAYSQFVPGNKRGARKEMELQAFLFREFAPTLSRLPIRGKRPASVLAGDFAYQVDRIYQGIKRRVGQRSMSTDAPPLEDWRVWLFERNGPFIKDLLQSSDTRVGEFVEESFIKRTIDQHDLRMLGKLLTTEIILRLIESRWHRFW